MEAYDYQRAKNELVNLTELVTKLEFAKGLVKEGLVEGEKIDSFEERQLKTIKTSMASVFAQLELNKVESRSDGIFAMTKDE